VQKHLSASLLINIPADVEQGQKRPAIFCCHGHDTFDKETIMGNDSSPELRDTIARNACNYGHVMAQNGFVTFGMDWIGFGERNDAGKPNFRDQAGQRDWCILYYLCATKLGMTPLAGNAAHGKAATNFMSTQSIVDTGKLGVMGLSGGGTMALWMTLCDERFRTTEVIRCGDLWADFGYRQQNWCGMQVAPGLFTPVDLPDLPGLVYPRPLLTDICVRDTCFLLDSAMECHKQVKRIYAAAGAADNLWLDLSPREHSS
jgi:hypothetical protein